MKLTALSTRTGVMLTLDDVDVAIRIPNDQWAKLGLRSPGMVELEVEVEAHHDLEVSR